VHGSCRGKQAADSRAEPGRREPSGNDSPTREGLSAGDSEDGLLEHGFRNAPRMTPRPRALERSRHEPYRPGRRPQAPRGRGKSGTDTDGGGLYGRPAARPTQARRRRRHHHARARPPRDRALFAAFAATSPRELEMKWQIAALRLLLGVTRPSKRSSTRRYERSAPADSSGSRWPQEHHVVDVLLAELNGCSPRRRSSARSAVLDENVEHHVRRRGQALRRGAERSAERPSAGARWAPAGQLTGRVPASDVEPHDSGVPGAQRPRTREAAARISGAIRRLPSRLGKFSCGVGKISSAAPVTSAAWP
jgi:hypothetical protein